MVEIINIANDYTRYPGPRYEADGPFSGEVFRDGLLAKALRNAIAEGARVIVTLDGVAGYGSSFLEEVFGGLVRMGFTREEIDNHLSVVAETNRFQHHVKSVQRYIDDAAVEFAH